MKSLSLSKREKKNLIRIIIALSAFFIVFLFDKIYGLENVFMGNNRWVFPFILYFFIYVFIGYDVLFKAARNILSGQFLDENFLMCIATIGAFSLGIYKGATGQGTDGFDEGCAVLLFYQIGEWFQIYATGKSRKSISSLMDIRPDYANVLRNGEIIKVSPEEVLVGEVVLINPGEKVPLDGVIVKGVSSLDTKSLTGESVPKDVFVGDEIVSGCINLSSQIEIKVQKEFYDSTVSKILDLVENASAQKSKAENFITKFARFYTPCIVFSALLLAVVPSLITSNWSTWIYRALNFLVVSCPCALVISVPLSFFAGIGAASKYGILIKGSNYLEKLDSANVFVFDKTGTLTKGNFYISKVIPEDKREEVLSLAAAAEQNSNHPIARSIVSAYGNNPENGYFLTNLAGKGVKAEKGDEVIYCGNKKLMEELNIKTESVQETGTVVYVAKNGKYVGSVLICDQIKEETREVIKELNAMNCKTVMLTGDNVEIAKTVAKETGVSSYKASLLPQNKVEEVERLLSEKNKKDALCFVGDGINDAPVLMRSDIGVAMGGVGSDAAIEASDIVLMKDDLRGIPLAKRIAKKTTRIVKQNVVFSLSVKVAILVLSALGITNMWIAVFGDVGVAVLAILNAMRVYAKYDKKV